MGINVSYGNGKNLELDITGSIPLVVPFPRRASDVIIDKTKADQQLTLEEKTFFEGMPVNIRRAMRAQVKMHRKLIGLLGDRKYLKRVSQLLGEADKYAQQNSGRDRKPVREDNYTRSVRSIAKSYASQTEGIARETWGGIKAGARWLGRGEIKDSFVGRRIAALSGGKATAETPEQPPRPLELRVPAPRPIDSQRQEPEGAA